MDKKGQRVVRSTAKSDGTKGQSPVPEMEQNLKVPTSLRDQVFVGMLNEVFSTCVFRSVPKIGSNPIPLVNSQLEPEKISYMLSLKWTKSKVLIQSISHAFSAYEGESELCQDDTSYYGERGELITAGLFNALKLAVKMPLDGSKIPVLILTKFINKEINRGGYWAYMSSPAFLNPNESDPQEIKIQEERRIKLLQFIREDLVVIRPSTILCLLWSIYYTNSHNRLKELCIALCYEFLENYHGHHQYLIYLLYLSQRMGLFPNDQVEKMINAKFNNLTSLENLSLLDIVVLINIPEHFKGFSTIGQKVSTLLFHHIDDMNTQTAVFVLSGLLRINFQFNKNLLFTRKLMSKIMSLYDQITSKELVGILLNTMSIVPCDVVGYFNQMLSKTLNRLHKFNSPQIATIACSYAIANNTSEILKELSQSDEETSQEIKDKLKGNYESTQTNNLYESLVYRFRRRAFQYRSEELYLIRSIHEAIIYSMGFQFSEELNKSDFEYNDDWFYNYSKHIPISKMNKSTTKIDVKALEDEANNPSYNTSYKLFFLNLVDDCFNNPKIWEEILISKILFSMLTLKIDLTPIYEAMLTTRGEMIKKGGGVIGLKTIESEKEMKKQYKLAKEIISWCRQRNGNEENNIMLEDILEEPFDMFETKKEKEVKVQEPVEPPKQQPVEPIQEKKTEEPKKEPENEKSNKSQEREEISVKNKEEPKSEINENKREEQTLKEEPKQKEVEKKEDKREEQIVKEEVKPKEVEKIEIIKEERVIKEEPKPKHVEKKEIKKEEPTLKEEPKPKQVEKSENKRQEKKLSREELLELIKIAGKLPKSSLVDGNPIYDLIKSQTLAAAGKASATEETTPEASETSEEESEAQLSGSLTKYKNGFKSLKAKKLRESRDSEGWVDVKQSKKSAKKGHPKGGEKKLSKLNRVREEVVFRVKQSVKAKMQLEKREVEITYKYVKLRK